MSFISQVLFNPRVSAIVLIWLVFWYRGIIDNLLLKLAPIPGWVPALFLICFCVIIFNKKKHAGRINTAELLIFLLFLVVIPSAVTGAKLASFSVISLFLSVFVTMSWGRFKSFNLKDKQWICNFALLTSTLSIIMFLYFVFVERPTLGVSEIRPGFGYAIDRGVLLRLVGFTSDPNFYCLGLMLPFLICIKERAIKNRKLILFVMIISFILTMSRSGAIIMILGLVLLFFTDIKRFSSLLLYSVIFSFFTMAAIAIYGGSLLVAENAELDRGFITGILSRFNFVENIVKGYSFELFGNGIGKSKELIGYHSHNTYFDFLFECGVIPFIIFMSYVILMLRQLFKNLNPLSIFAILIFVSIFSVSLPFNPIIYLIPLVCLRMKYVEETKNAH